MRKIFKKFKKLTGYKYSDLANHFNVSKQFIDKSIDNFSLTYSNSNKFMINEMINLKIEELENKIEELKEFKKEVKEFKNNKKENKC